MEVINLARKLGEELAASDEYKNFCTTRDKCRENAALKVKLDEFKVQKSILDVEKEKDDDERDEGFVDAVSVRVEKLYNEITNDPDMKAYNKAEEDLNLLMTAINMTITSYISPESLSGKYGEGDGDFDGDDGCTHNCSTCHGCH